ncbi:integrase, catalytic region, zinc finger, CCHC-type containing protein, partial [Tanacetum coccineum]
TNNQLRASSNARNQAMVQDGKVVVQDIRGRYNATNQGRPFQRNNARGNGVAGNVGAPNRGGMINPGQVKPIKCYNCNGLGHIARECPRPKRLQDSGYFKDKMLLMQAQENGAVLGKSNTQKHKARVNDSTEASGSKPRCNTKKNRILPAKKENKKEVEVRLRTNKSVWTKVNRVDSSISSKRVVINSNSESVNSASHEMCVVNILNSVNATPTVRIVLHKGKLSDNSLYKTQRVWKATGKLFADIGYQWRPTGKKFALGEICQLTKLSVKCSTLYANQQVMLWYLDSGCSKHMTGNRSKLMNFVEKFIGSVRFGNDHLGAIMGYGDYVMGDSVISRVYYVEGLGHNLFSVGQFCDSDLEVAFRKHTCFVRDIKGTDILKGSRGTNLYTISIDEIMKSSPICLLSKASKSKSWLWHSLSTWKKQEVLLPAKI